MGNHPGSEVRPPSIGRSLSTSDITTLNVLKYRYDKKNNGKLPKSSKNGNSFSVTDINGVYKRKTIQGTPKYSRTTV